MRTPDGIYKTRLPGGTRQRATLGPSALGPVRPGPALACCHRGKWASGEGSFLNGKTSTVCNASRQLREQPPARAALAALSAPLFCLRRREKDSMITHLSPAQPPDDYKEVTTPYGCLCRRLVMCLRPTLPCHFQTKVNCWELGVGRPPIGVNLSLCRTAYNSSNPEAQAECDFVSRAEAAHLIQHSSPPLCFSHALHPTTQIPRPKSA